MILSEDIDILLKNHEYENEKGSAHRINKEFKERSSKESIQERYKEMKSTLSSYMQKDYESYIKAVLSVENSISDEEISQYLYDQYMQRDEMHLLNDMFTHFQMEHLYKLDKLRRSEPDIDLENEMES